MKLGVTNANDTLTSNANNSTAIAVADCLQSQSATTTSTTIWNNHHYLLLSSLVFLQLLPPLPQPLTTAIIAAIVKAGTLYPLPPLTHLQLPSIIAIAVGI